MKLRILALIVLCSGVLSAPALAQTSRPLTPVSAQELSKYIGSMLYGRAQTRLGIISKADRRRGTVMIAARNGEMATIPFNLLGRNGMRLRAPAIAGGDVAAASFAGKSTVPLRGEVTVTEDAPVPSSLDEVSLEELDRAAYAAAQ